MRKLVSIQEIKEINAIPNADSIEVATINGWKAVVTKGQFKIGDKILYAEIDSKFPIEERFSILERTNYIVKTLKLRGQISQGLCLPLDYLSENIKEFPIGLDVTEDLKVTKFEKPIPEELKGEVKYMFPSFISSTSIDRIQSITTEELNDFINTPLYLTEKLEGVSMTVFHAKDRELTHGVCSKGLVFKEESDIIYNKLEKKYDIVNKIKSTKRSLAIQGELIGHGIEGNIYNFPKDEYDFRVFRIWDIDESKALSMEEMLEICSSFGLNSVPILEKDFIFDGNIDVILKSAEIKSTLANVNAEGFILVSPKSTKFTKPSIKVISNKYLLSGGKKQKK